MMSKSRANLAMAGTNCARSRRAWSCGPGGRRLQIPGVHGCLVGGVDGLLITHNLQNDASPDDLAALTATMFGLGRQVGFRLGQGDFQQSTVRNQNGYLSVYPASRQVLLAVVGTDSINVARLHLHAPTAAARLADLLDGVTPTTT
ncbi:roadblock/LC7 domain-containing protein [Micromonospora sp. NPDC049282]|uniref:roadblock/LC7 domain-containing protein n=1 Tax=Micromonospora sp. NPDC049282 TaxID=3364269 RepID=UPI0037189EF6